MNSKAYKSYEISKNEYRELKYFCLRYREMKKHVDKLYQKGCGAGRIGLDVRQIESALEMTTDNEILRAYLKRAVTENIKFENLGVPMGRQQFYELRRKFFYMLKTLKMG